jgi:hypothetical protein
VVVESDLVDPVSEARVHGDEIGAIRRDHSGGTDGGGRAKVAAEARRCRLIDRAG